MPAYFYHLAFELHTRNPSLPEDNSKTFTPERNQDIFQAPLPVHQSSSWASYIAPRRGSSSYAGLRTNRQSDKETPDHNRIGPAREDKSNFDTVNLDLSGELRGTHEDWRSAEITIEAVDMNANTDSNAKVEREEGSMSGADVQLAATGLATKGKYIPSDPWSTDVGYGVVHLYRDGEPAALTEGTNGSHDIGIEEAYIDNDCTTLCVLAVPSYMTPSDLLGWVGEETREKVSHFRLVRTSRSNRYMVLMKFRESTQAKEWQRRWNGKLFNIMEASAQCV